jgi:biopolymer transport protein ExbD
MLDSNKEEHFLLVPFIDLILLLLEIFLFKVVGVPHWRVLATDLGLLTSPVKEKH